MKILLSVVFLAGIAKATILSPYTATPCGGREQVECSVHSEARIATDAQVAHFLTSTMFSAWASLAFGYNWNRLGVQADFSFSNVKMNPGGVMVGDYFSRGFASSFVYQAGQVACCTTDSPFHIADINSDEMIVGYMPGRGGFLAYGGLINADQHPIDLSFTNGFVMNPYADTFLAIDNQNRILMLDQFAQQSYMLAPVDSQPTTVPEPASIFLLGAALSGCAIVSRRRRPL